MECPQCGHSIKGKALFCPNCGHKLVQTAPVPHQAAAPTRVAQPEREAAPKQGCGLSLTVLAVAAFFLMAIVGLGVAGVYYGLADRAKAEREAAEEHFQKGLVYLKQERYELAIAEFDLVVRLDPEHEQVLGKQAEARQKLSMQPTPTPVLQEETNYAYLRELREAHANADWQKVFDLAEQLSSLDPAYYRDEVNEMLFDAYYNTGLQMVAGDRMKDAVRLFDQALALHPDDAHVAEAKELATLYLAGLAFWNADWAKTADNFSALYERAPDYKDVRQRTHEAHVAYAELLSARGDHCAAADRYGQALRIMATFAVASKLHDAELLCKGGPPLAEQTPTLIPTAGPTRAPLGTFVGAVVEQTAIESGKMFIRGRVLDKGDRGVQGTRVQIKAWDWKTVAVTDGNGQFSFDGLSGDERRDPVTYTLTLLDLPSLPFDVGGEWGKIKWVHFIESH